MKSLSVLVSLCLALANGLDTAETLTTCRTFLTSESTKGCVKTTSQTETITLHPTIIVTTTPVTTETPAAFTITSTDIIAVTSTAVIVTDTFSVTSTETSSFTVTSATTSTETDSVTSTITVTSTTTVDAPSGFIYPTPTPGGKKRHIDRQRKSYQERNVLAKRAAAASQRCTSGDQRFPYKVICEVVIEEIVPTTVTVTADTTQTVFAATPTVTTTIQSTTTFVSVLPDASTTLSFTETDSVTSTSTVMETDTVTSTITATYQPTATYYAQCGPQNLVSTDPSGALLIVNTDGGTNNQLVPSVSDAYSCCVSCVLATNCAGSNFVPQFGLQACELNIFDSCPADQSLLTGTYGTEPFVPVTVSNGACGYWQYE